MGFTTTRDSITGREVFACEAGFTGCQRTHCRAVRCPYGWCKRYYVCPSCMAEFKAEHKRLHAKGCSCDVSAQASKARNEQKQNILSSGAYLRCWAIGKPEGVHVGFKNATGDERVYIMESKTYGVIPLGVPATVEDYEKIGSLRLLAPQN